MAASSPQRPPRFVVQCAKGKGWKTLVVDESQPAAERAFHEVIKVNPKGYFRLIRLDDSPEPDFEGENFSWKLLQLHDPKKGGVQGGVQGGVATAPINRPARRHGPNKRRIRRQGEKVAIPLRLYILALILGAIAAVALYLLHGPSPMVGLGK